MTDEQRESSFSLCESAGTPVWRFLPQYKLDWVALAVVFPEIKLQINT